MKCGIYGPQSISMRTVFRWVKAFKAGKFSVEDDTRPGRPKIYVTKANTAAVKIVVEQDARLSVRDIASCTSISECSVQTIMKKRLDLRKVCARWVPHLLTEEQKTQRLKCARELLKTYKGCNSRVTSNLLTGDETWVHMFEPQRRVDNKQWKRFKPSTYSPDLSPCDFFLFPRLKKMLSGNKYTSRSSLGSAIYQCLQQIPKRRLIICFSRLGKKVTKCVSVNGEYFVRFVR